MKHYELLAIISGTLSEEETKNAQEAIRAVIEKHQGRVSKQDVWEKRKLAYPINHVRQGTYLLFMFDAEPSQVEPIDRALALEKTLLRHLLIIAHQKTAKELENEVRHQASLRAEERAESAPEAKPVVPISKKELDEKLAEILTDDMVK